MGLSQTEFNLSAVNEYHVACVLLLDTSTSMQGPAIDSLNKAVRAFKDQTMMDDLAQKRIDIAVVEFNSSATIKQDFVPLAMFEPTILNADGWTSLGAGLELAISLVEKQKDLYRQVGTPYYRPWIFLITDGEPTDEYKPAAQKVVDMSNRKGVICWAVGVKDYNKNVLKEITNRVIELGDVNFTGLFEWLSNSLVISSITEPGVKPDYPQLPVNARVVPDDWD